MADQVRIVIIFIIRTWVVPRIYSSHKGFEKSLYGTFFIARPIEKATFKKAEERLYAGNTQAVRQSCCSEGED